MQITGGQGGTQCPACITGGRLYPDPVKGAVTQYLAIGDAVEGNPASQTQITNACLGRQ